MAYLNADSRFDELVTLQSALKSTEMIRCRCDCGKIVSKQAFRMVAGTAKRCRGRSHGLSLTHSKMYKAWLGMISRCYNEAHESYPNYGGRGISVCDGWRDSFLRFLSDMGERPEGFELDRIDNNGDYEPNNCRWASRSENNRNKRTNRLLTVFGETKCCQDWIEDGRSPVVSKKTLEKRLRLGWSDFDAVMTPVGEQR